MRMLKNYCAIYLLDNVILAFLDPYIHILTEHTVLLINHLLEVIHKFECISISVPMGSTWVYIASILLELHY